MLQLGQIPANVVDADVADVETLEHGQVSELLHALYHFTKACDYRKQNRSLKNVEASH